MRFQGTLVFVGAALAVVSLFGGPAALAQGPRANGETVNIQHYAGTTGNVHGFVAAKKGFCEKYNFHCELKIINSGVTGLQTLVGKSIDIAQTGTDLTAASINAGAELVIIGTSIDPGVLFVVARSDVPLPNKAKGYPDVIRDLKGLKIGVPARGAAAEVYLNVMLREAGLQPSDVTYVAVGGPQTGYTTMVIGKQVDAAVLFEPLKALCKHTQQCRPVLDMDLGEGPSFVKDIIGSGVVFVARRDYADGNPALMAAFLAAMRDAIEWAQDPKNIDELVELYKPSIGFGDIPGGEQLRHDWIQSVVGNYSKDLGVNRHGVESTLKFGFENKTTDKIVPTEKIVWDKAPAYSKK